MPTESPTRSSRSSVLNAATDLLPWCASHGRLSREQVIGLSDVAGNMKEVVLLALSAGVDESAKTKLERALGDEAAFGIIEFWGNEYAID